MATINLSKTDTHMTLRVTTGPESFAIKDELKARGYRFVKDEAAKPGTDASIPAWTLVLPLANVAAIKAEAEWVKASGHTPRIVR